MWLDLTAWDRRTRWTDTLHDMCSDCWRLALQGKEYKPKYNRLEGGRHGFAILDTARHPRFQRRVMDIARWEREGMVGPVHECTDESPQTRTEWNLMQILACAARRELERPGTQDMQTPWEALNHGLHNRSTLGWHDTFVPPYPTFWEREHFMFAMHKFAEKLDIHGTMFEKPRLHAITRFTPTAPANIHAITVAESAAGKLRVAIDFGSPRSLDAQGRPGWEPPKAKQSGPLSVNAHEDKALIPNFDFMDPQDLWRRAAIMMQAGHTQPTTHLPPITDESWIIHAGRTSDILREQALARRCVARQAARRPPPGLRIATVTADQAAWYEQSPAPSSNDRMKVIAVALGAFIQAPEPETSMTTPSTTPRGACTIDPRTTFGDRLAAFLTYLMTMQGVEELRSLEPQARQAFLASDSVPLDCQAGLYWWMDTRRMVGEPPAWIEPGAFFDDSQFLIFMFFLKEAKHIIFQIWKDWNFDVADGTRKRKDKVECLVEPECPIVLGEQPSMAARRRDIPQSKLDALDKLLDEITAATAAHPARGTDVTHIERFRGRAQHMSNAKRTMKADLQVSYELIGSAKSQGGSRAPSTRRFQVIDAEAADRLRQVAHRARVDKGASFFPRTGWLGKHGRGIICGATDASCKVEKPPPPGSQPEPEALERDSEFSGWGAWAHVEGTDIVFITQQHSTANARRTLNDSTAVELVANNEYVTWLAELAKALGADLLNISDSTSATGICMGSRARAAAERELYAQRCEALDRIMAQNPDLAIMTHAVRRERNQEADLTTKHVVLVASTDGHPREPKAEQDLQAMLDTRFGRTMYIIYVPPPAGARERLTPVLRRHERSIKRARRLLKRAMRLRVRHHEAQRTHYSDIGYILYI